MKTISKPTRAELTAIMPQVDDVQAWRAKLLGSFETVLKKKPLTYRAFGPYWWLLKRMFIEHDIVRFGTSSDAEWVEATDYGDDTLNLLAIYAFYDHSSNIGLLYSNAHTVPLEDGEALNYVLVDEDMEIQAIGR